MGCQNSLVGRLIGFVPGCSSRTVIHECPARRQSSQVMETVIVRGFPALCNAIVQQPELHAAEIMLKDWVTIHATSLKR